MKTVIIYLLNMEESIMKCENCGKNEVSFVYRSNINGKVEEKHLCHECAEKLGYTQKIQDSYSGFQNLFRNSFSSLFAPMHALAGRAADPFFGDSFFGGSFLGDRFFDDFFSMPALGGSTSEAAAPAQQQENLVSDEEQKKISRERELNALRAEMKQAVESENFERAAQLRDQIHAKEKEN